MGVYRSLGLDLRQRNGNHHPHAEITSPVRVPTTRWMDERKQNSAHITTTSDCTLAAAAAAAVGTDWAKCRRLTSR
jgi:predicted DNA-binding ribbon-helix-helix protein